MIPRVLDYNPSLNRVEGDATITGNLQVDGTATINVSETVTGNVTVTGDLAVNGGDLTSTATTFNLLNATVTTLNIGSAATTVSIGAGAASTLNANFTTAINLNTNQLAVSGVGPHAIGGAVNNDKQIGVFGTFIPTGGGSANILSLASTVNVAAGTNAYGLLISPTFVEADSGVHALMAQVFIAAPTNTVGAATVTNTASLYIAGSINATVTGANYAVWVDDGESRFDGDITTGTTTFNLLNTVATTVNAFGAATAISIGAATGTLTINNPAVVAALLYGSTAANGDLTLEGTSSATKTTSYVILQPTGGNVGIGVVAPATLLELENVTTITGAVTDGYSAALTLDPGYTAATALTVTRHNYIDVNNVSVAGAGPAAVTDACIFRFDAALGTHKATVAASTKTTPGGVDGWIKMNCNGTLMYVPMYLSTTA